MADTLTLDTAVQFAINRGGCVRLIGDDQRLAAIGAVVSCATSNRATARCISPCCTASPTPPNQQQHRSPSATATRDRSTSTSAMVRFMSATWRPCAGTQHQVSVRTGQPQPAAYVRRAAARGGVEVRPIRRLDPCGRWPGDDRFGRGRRTLPSDGTGRGRPRCRGFVTACLPVRDQSGTGSHPPTAGSRRDSTTSVPP
jgi:hypothetical protein